MGFRKPKQIKQLLHKLKTKLIQLKCKHQYILYKSKELMGIEVEFQKCKICEKERCR